MAITYQGGGTPTASAAGSTTCVVAYPSGIQAGDLIVCWVGSANVTPPAMTGASGLTAAGFTSAMSGTSNAVSPSYRIAYKVATGSESGNVTVVTSSGANQGKMHLFRGVDQTTPLDVAGTSFGSSVGVTAYDIPTLTTTRPGVALFYIGGVNTNSGSWTPATNPATFTETHDSNAQTPTSTACYLIWSGSGATGTVNAVRSASTRGYAAMIALRPADVRVRNIPRPVAINRASFW